MATHCVRDLVGWSFTNKPIDINDDRDDKLLPSCSEPASDDVHGVQQVSSVFYYFHVRTRHAVSALISIYTVFHNYGTPSF